MTNSDTIFALSSGLGRAAIAILRISGGSAGAVLESLVGALPSAREFALRTLRNSQTGEVLDRSVVVWLPAPLSFTGEDCAELHLHGSPSVVAAVMAYLNHQPGVRPAEPGEFTRRAFVKGKLDLIEVEGLADLLDARTASQREQAMRQMTGEASSTFESWRGQLLSIRADIEAAVDFADEADIAVTAIQGVDGQIEALLQSITAALARSKTAEVVRDGVRVVLSGHPNTGKSSLLNHLARREVAIVSDVPGTTRDSIEVSLDLNGIPIILTDTAGLRFAASDAVEAEGMRRSRHHMAQADVLVWVWSDDVFGSENPDPVRCPDIVVRNKCDLRRPLVNHAENIAYHSISARTGQGIEGFVDALQAMLGNRFGDVDSALIVSARQQAVVIESIRLLNDCLAVSSAGLELKAEILRLAAEEIGRLTGRVDVEEWLGVIFSRFCIGK
ncbi:tRNA uridine-5-carboxymethylaminomethyl(34) synthesis GTPase MnmE [Aestuariivirga sp.]|uniref:tRNA uridine-5-carboxymethylaminomethyl(34) synthesis GTPase MnmE n=1 Tax=Aestuariivirga sp. TaxID=2650926 RepID=UPI003BA9AB0C